MTIRRNIIASLVVLTTIGATPVLADKGHHDKGHKAPKHSQHDNGRHLALGHDKQRKKDDHRRVDDRHDHVHRYKIGDRLSRDQIARLRNPSAHGLEQRRGWDYYSDGKDAYRVDSGTQRVLAVINLINAFSN